MQQDDDKAHRTIGWSKLSLQQLQCVKCHCRIEASSLTSVWGKRNRLSLKTCQYCISFLTTAIHMYYGESPCYISREKVKYVINTQNVGTELHQICINYKNAHIWQCVLISKYFQIVISLPWFELKEEKNQYQDTSVPLKPIYPQNKKYWLPG